MSETPSPLSGTPPSQTSLPSRGKRHRIRHQKSRKGCFTCKQRRVKCDEAQPICGACAFRGENCSYPRSTTLTLELSSAAPRSPRRTNHTTNALQPLDFRLDGLSTETPFLDQEINMADLRLLSRFIVHTAKEMTPHAKRRPIWEQVIPDLASKKEYLMHLLLALAGEHVLYQIHMSGSHSEDIDDTQSSLPSYSQRELQLEYHRVIQHHQRGLEGFRQALTDISPATAEYVFCGSILIVAISFASISTRAQSVTELGLSRTTEDKDLYIDWLHLVRGLSSVAHEHWFTLKLSRLRAMLFYTYANDDWKITSIPSHFHRLKHAPEIFHIFAQGATQSLDHLRAFATTLEQPDTEPDYSNNYTHTLNTLEEIYMRILYVLQFSRSGRDNPPALDIQIDMEDSAVISWPSKLSARFVNSLGTEQLGTAEAFSFVILAHFYLISCLFRDIWYLNSGFGSEIRKVSSLVDSLGDSALAGLMEWPVAVAESV
ncbi:hypothetical protein BDV25DRAFT_128066 [Aspergillus avenaceus]|uniref:Zn(2)-C6 fungal-type domain-containing protein n=1 Tax=Aspergillus avenaceus TaxID=36643 RepID=A0A5N6U1B7_ASPAV|nr:hypothetical protein BDV25DRAFT_128066 [Aspergillus avenaceus]